jgi:predicted amidophosphoribosyltransferase
MKEIGGIEQPDTWLAGPTFGREAMIACPSCKGKTRTFDSTQFCDKCGAQWTRNGVLLARPPGVPDGALFVFDDEKLSPGDVPAWGGTAMKRGNIIEF